MKETTRLKRWVLHTPYADGTWRGIEKCWNDVIESVTLFDTEKAAIEAVGDDPGGYRVVRVVLEVPAIRQPLDSVTPTETA